jgi:hypothetical protein
MAVVLFSIGIRGLGAAVFIASFFMEMTAGIAVASTSIQTIIPTIFSFISFFLRLFHSPVSSDLS